MTATGKPKLNASGSDGKPNVLEKTSEELKQKSYVNVKEIGTDYTYKHKMVWKNAILFALLHVLGLWGVGIILTGGVGLRTLIFGAIVLVYASEGITVGAHRYYAHKTFKAKPLLRALLMLAQTIGGQNSVYTWARDHRLHHRYSDTDADPHNSKRGFFFSHIGWLMMRKHPYVAELGKRIDMSDLEADWMVVLQKKYYMTLYYIIAIFLPVWIPVNYFGESWLNSFLVCYTTRYAFQLNVTWLVNSAAHLYGTRPYDKNLQPVESWFVSFLSLGEGWHNYHHAFPWDYKAAELSTHLNYSAYLIKFLEKIGLAYDLKTASPELIDKRIQRTGDGTHYKLGNDEARAMVEAVGPLHPMNPTYNVKYQAPLAMLKDEGLPLFYENDVLNVRNCIDTRKETSG